MTLSTQIHGALGCGVWEAQIAPQGGTSILLEGAPSALHLSRKLDDFSEADVTFPISDIPDYCLRPLAKLRSWAYELELLRDGVTQWAGPISSQITYTRESLTLRARDLFHWFERRELPNDRTQTKDLCETFADYIDDALSRDPRPNIIIDKLPCGIVEERSVLATDHRYASDAMRELARDGVEFTMIGRTIRIRGIGAGNFAGTLIDAHFGPDTTATLEGLAVASEVIVVGNTPNGTDIAVSGSAGGVDPNIGLVQQVNQESFIVTDSGAQAAAEADLAVSGIEPMQFTSTLDSQAAIAFADLIPGDKVYVNAQVGLRLVDEVMRLDSVSVDVSPDEKVTVVLVREGEQ